MASPHVEVIGPTTLLGEAPHWDADRQVLYYVDINSSTVNKYDPATKKVSTAQIEGGIVNFIIPVDGKKDQFAINVGRHLSVLTWDGESSVPTKVETVVSVEDGTNNSFNDGKADPTGRLWSGTIGPIEKTLELGPLQKIGKLYSITNGQAPVCHVTNIHISNGLTWSPDGKTMYYIDSMSRKVDAFNFDAASGLISNRRTAFDFEINGVKGYPDGMTVDTEGNLWVACLGGSKVIRVDPTAGKLVSAVDFPCPQVTCPAFGGPQLDELYVTTGVLALSEDDKRKYPISGSTFRVTGLGAKGFAGTHVKL
ncbi:regucalcin-like [Bacillus rossius redtenbacheri]|uniref:regucalcin-like n=1 Tax=Bacillus rossius redtenbacheri TaxID=93214 RepID=UPI002FDEE10F